MSKMKVQDATKELSRRAAKLLGDVTGVRTAAEKTLAELRKIENGFTQQQEAEARGKAPRRAAEGAQLAEQGMDDARRCACGKDRGEEGRAEACRQAAGSEACRSCGPCGPVLSRTATRRAHRAAALPRAEIVLRAHRAHRAAILRRAETVRRR